MVEQESLLNMSASLEETSLSNQTLNVSEIVGDGDQQAGGKDQVIQEADAPVNTGSWQFSSSLGALLSPHGALKR